MVKLPRPFDMHGRWLRTVLIVSSLKMISFSGFYSAPVEDTESLSQAEQKLQAVDPQGRRLLDERLDAIVMLAKIAESSVAMRQVVSERLSRYIRENASLEPTAFSSAGHEDSRDDLEAALEVLGQFLPGLDEHPTADLHQVDLSQLRLHKVSLPGVDLSDSRLDAVQLSHADLRGANLKRCELAESDLRETDLRGANLESANLSAAVLLGANLYQTILKRANLKDATLVGANLYAAVLREADLSHADFRGADLRRADLSGVLLRETDLTDAVLSGANLSGVDLRTARGLQRRQLDGVRTDQATRWPETTETIGGGTVKAAGSPVLDRPTEPSVIRKPEDSSGRAEGWWPQFRGPYRDGHYTGPPISLEWPSEGPPELWRREIGGGYASMAVAAGRIFTIEQHKDTEVVTSYDLRTGDELWTHTWPAFFQVSVGGDGTLAGGPRATPTWDGGRLYALGAGGELRCLDADTGNLIWARNILWEHDAERIEWGMAGSPLVIGEKLIVQPGGRQGNSVVAYNKFTGDLIWASLDDQQAYVSPMHVTLAGRSQILTISAARLMGIAPEDGSLLWEYPWVTPHDVNASQPLVVSENQVFVSSGYGKGAAVVRIEKEDESFKVAELWKNIRMKNKFNSSVLHEGHVYGLDESILACIDVHTGERRWKGGRYGYGQVVLVQGHLIVLTEDGDVVLVRATPRAHEELARFPALNGRSWNHPVLTEGLLIVRNEKAMVCYDLSRSDDSP